MAAFILPTLLLVDNDQTLATRTQAALSEYQTIWASDAQAALHLVEHDHPDLVLLDLMLPDIDGLQLVGIIRRASSVPIIVASVRAAQVDRVLSLQTGADDFIAKPFDLDDLEARIEAVLRRSKRTPLPPAQPTFEAGALTITDTLAHVAGVVVFFPPIEHRIVLVLAQNADELVTFAMLSEVVWGDDLASPHLIHTHLGRIRARLSRHPEAPKIESWRRRGFVMRTELALT